MVFRKEQILRGLDFKAGILLAGLFFIPLDSPAQQSAKSNSALNKNTTPANQGTSSSPAPVVIKDIPQISTEGLVARAGKGGLLKGEYAFYLLKLANKSRKNVKSLSPEERKAALSEGLDDELIFQAALEDGALNDKYIRFMMSSLFRSNQTVANISPDKFSDAELKAYYDAHMNEFCTPSEKHIKGAKFNSTASASDFIKKLKKAKEPASVPEWNDFGWLVEGKQIVELPSDISDKVLKLKKGQISEPLAGQSSRDTCFVFFCSEQKEAAQLPFDEVKGKVKFALVGQKQKENYDNLLKKMGFDPKKISEEDALFLSALNNGLYREITVRQYCINAYVDKKKLKREQLLPELKKKYPITIIEEAK